MGNAIRLRQLCLIAEDLDSMLSRLGALLEVPVCYRDPGLIHFGLANGLLALGGDFLEIVSPVRPDTAGGRHLARHGDSGYMIIVQCEDAAPRREYITKLGVRPVWKVDGEGDRAGVVATHFHPRDVGAAILSIDSMGVPDWREAYSRWIWAGQEWRTSINESCVGRFAAAEIVAVDPERLAAHWAQLLGCSMRAQDDAMFVDLDGASLRFVASDGQRADGLTGIDFMAGDQGRDRFYRNAADLDLPCAGDAVELCGMRLRVIS